MGARSCRPHQPRLCEERSDEAIHLTAAMLLRCARNDGLGERKRGACRPHQPRLCEERSDEAIHLTAAMDCFAPLAMTSWESGKAAPVALTSLVFARSVATKQSI